MRRCIGLTRRLRHVSRMSAATNAPLIGHYGTLLGCSSSSRIPSLYGGFTSIRSFSSNSDNWNNGDEPLGKVVPEIINAPDDMNTSMSPITVPDYWPIVPVIAIGRRPLFPGFVNRVTVKDEALKALIKRRLKMRHPFVGVFLKNTLEGEDAEMVDSMSDLHPIGCFAQITVANENGEILELLLSGERRIRLIEPVDESAETSGDVSRVNGRRGRQTRPNDEPKEEIKEKVDEGPEINTQSTHLLLVKTENVSSPTVVKSLELQATIQAIIQVLREVIDFSPMFMQQIMMSLRMRSVFDDPIFLCNMIGTFVNGEAADLQSLLEEDNIQERLRKSLILIEKEKALVKLKHEINKDVETKINAQHRKFLLNEQLKAIKKELGIEKDDKQAIAEKMDDRIKSLTVPEYVMKVIKEEQTKLSYLDPHSSEFSVARNYLDWLTCMPWGKTSKDQLDLEKASIILNEDHYGMEDVKNRILEFIAIGILKKTVSGKILCFHGPPGVGKTSIAKSIARALSREYFRFSVGGMTDVAEIKGHRRTYIGAMPGKMIQCLKKVQTENPIVLIDEVDKIGGAGHQGDPSSALLELLDPEQNANFNDHFLDVPVDLSKVLFICTANVIDTIPGPLRDRMELIEVSGYVAEEKVNIADSYLVPQCREDSSLDKDQLQIAPNALQVLIKQYCRESGVRNLQKQIEKIFRKAAYKIAGAKEDLVTPIMVESTNLEDFVGRPKFTTDRLYTVTPVGVVMGLAWTAMGGSALYIEACLGRALSKSKTEKTSDNAFEAKGGSMQVTGHLGDVMKESVQIAYTVAKDICRRRFSDNEFLEKAHIHVHVPEGATPKDGPSAGCTITSALLSLALNTSIRQNISMTGEITLTGRILPVGGIKEKIIAATRAGVNCVILPDENRKDFSDLPDFIRKDVEVHFVSSYDEVFEIAFRDLK